MNKIDLTMFPGQYFVQIFWHGDWCWQSTGVHLTLHYRVSQEIAEVSQSRKGLKWDIQLGNWTFLTAWRSRFSTELILQETKQKRGRRNEEISDSGWSIIIVEQYKFSFNIAAETWNWSQIGNKGLWSFLVTRWRTLQVVDLLGKEKFPECVTWHKENFEKIKTVNMSTSAFYGLS